MKRKSKINYFLGNNADALSSSESTNNADDAAFIPNELVRAVKLKELSKRDNSRLRRENGEAYLGYIRVGSKVIHNSERPARQQGPRCASKFCERSSLRQCNIFDEKERKELFDKFWQMNWEQKRMYICRLVKDISIKERKVNEESSRRKCSKEYFLLTAFECAIKCF